MSSLTLARPIASQRVHLEPLLSRRVRPSAGLAFCIDAGLIFVLFVAVQSYLPEHHRTSAALAGYVLAAYGAAKLAGQFGAGRLIDRIRPRRGLALGLCLTTAGQAAMLLAALRTEAAIPAAAIYGIGGAVVWPSIFAIAAEDFAESERARLSSAMTAATGAAVAAALGLGFILPQGFPYEVAIMLAMAGALGAFYFARGLPEASDLPNTEEWPAIGLARTMISGQRLAFSLIIFLQAAILGAILAIFRGYGADILHTSLRNELLLLMPAGAAGACAVLAGGSLADRYGRIPVLGAGYLLVTFSIWGLSTSGYTPAVIVLSVTAALGLAMALPCTGALSMDLAKSVGTGTLLGWFLTMEGAGHAIGPAAAGLVAGKAGTAPVLWLVGGLAAAIAVIALVAPIWSQVRDSGRRRPFGRALFSGTAKGTVLAGVILPVIATYVAWNPSSQLYGAMISHGPRDRMHVAITFDDGPNAPWTTRIADVLDRQGVAATFFVVGQNAEAHPEIVRDLAARGNLIGNHSYHHRKRDAILDPDYSDLWKAEEAIASAAGVCPAIYRPPNGFHTPWQLHAVEGHGMKTVTWDVIPRDWKNPQAATIVSRVMDSVRAGSIILLHDGDDTNQGTDRSATLQALPGIIQGLRERGYEIVRLDKLLGVPAYLPDCN